MVWQSIGPLVALACLWAAFPASASTAPGMPVGWSDQYIYANGARLHYYHAVSQPGKPVIVMVHGITDNGLSWTTLTEDLQRNYDIYMLDARAHGLSDPFSDTNTGDTLTNDVAEFVRIMKFDRPILMGHSMGAATVMRVGAQYPTLARAIIMLDPGLGGARPAPAARPLGVAAGNDTPSAGDATAFPSVRRSGRLAMFGTPELLVAQNNESYDEWLATCARQNALWDPVDCQYWALSKRQYHGSYSVRQAEAMRGTMDTQDALARITVPALILKADATPEVREANFKAAGVMKNGKLIHVDGAGHNLHHDKRARSVALLNDFLGKL